MTDRDVIARAAHKHLCHQDPDNNYRDWFSIPKSSKTLTDAILAALDAAGRVIVPREPTRLMALAGLAANGKTDTLSDIYSAMLAAAGGDDD